MITPKFALTQNDEFVIVTAYIPHAHLDDLDFHISEHVFRLYIQPYFLRLAFDKQLADDDRQHAKYDRDDGELKVWLPKAVKGSMFEDLDMHSKLLGGVSQSQSSCGIQVLSSNVNVEDEQNDDFSWPQKEPESGNELLNNINNVGFGFDSRHEWNPDIAEALDSSCKVDAVGIDLDTDGEGSNSNSIGSVRLDAERDQWDPEHYVADYVCDDAVKICLEFKPWWASGAESSSSPSSSKVQLSEEEYAVLDRLKFREFALANRRRVLLDLASLLYAIAYEIRTTDGEGNVESGWTISKISPVLSWLEKSNSNSDLSLKETFVTCVRRVLCYPLYRHFGLAVKCISDCQAILAGGRRSVLKALLFAYHVFEKDEQRAVFNRLFIEDYLVWIQGSDEGEQENGLRWLCDEVASVHDSICLQDIDIADLKSLQEYGDENRQEIKESMDY